jgi:hypothetical protein
VKSQLFNWEVQEEAGSDMPEESEDSRRRRLQNKINTRSTFYRKFALLHLPGKV